MNRGVFYKRVALEEFENSILWYERQEPGLGARFRACVERHIETIARDPERFAKVRGEVRRQVVQAFPFAIHFVVEERGVVVLAIYHASRNPETLNKRR